MRNTKGILMSILMIGVVAMAAGAGTFAYFSDTETSEGNTFTAGTIDLAVNDKNPWEGPVATFTDVKPSQELDSIELNFQNVGNNEGILTFNCHIDELDKCVDDNGPMDGATYTIFEFAADNGDNGTCTQDRSLDAYPQWEMTGDEFAKLIYVKSVTFATSDAPTSEDILNDWVAYADKNEDGKVSLYEICQKTWTLDYNRSTPETVDPLPADKTATIVVEFHLGDAFEGDLTNWPTYNGNFKIISDGTTVWNVPQADGVEVTLTAVLDQVP